MEQAQQQPPPPIIISKVQKIYLNHNLEGVDRIRKIVRIMSIPKVTVVQIEDEFGTKHHVVIQKKIQKIKEQTFISYKQTLLPELSPTWDAYNSACISMNNCSIGYQENNTFLHKVLNYGFFLKPRIYTILSDEDHISVYSPRWNGFVWKLPIFTER